MPPATHPAANLKASLNLQHVGLGLCGLGLLLMIASVFWPRMTKTDAVWTDGQAREYASAAGTYHQLAFEHGAKGEDPAQGEPDEVTAARNAYKLLRGDLDRARAAGQAGARILKWLGVAFALLGCAMLVIQRLRKS